MWESFARARSIDFGTFEKMPTERPPTTLALVLALAVMTLCCALPLGIPGVVLALQGRAAANGGDFDVARRRTRASFVLSAIGAALGLLVEVFFLVRHLARGFQ